MAQTQTKGSDIGNGSVGRVDINTTVTGSAVITKIVDGAAGVKINSSTGIDAGTGDVVLKIDTTYLDAIYAKLTGGAFTGKISSLNLIEGFTTTPTAAGTTTLTVDSNFNQFFTGTSTQTVKLPVASTLTLGHSFWIVNRSTGAVTVNSSGNNAVLTIPASSSGLVICILTSGTNAASWYSKVDGGGGVVLGETSATAYRGDMGKIAYDYSQAGHLPLSGGTMANTNLVANLNAKFLEGIDLVKFIYGASASGSNSAPVTWSAAHITQYKSGFWDINGASWTPDADWWWGVTISHTSNTASYNYCAQLVFRIDGSKIYTRTIQAGTPGPWKEIVAAQRLKPREYTTTTLATLSPNPDLYDYYQLTLQTSDLVLANYSVGAPVTGECFWLRIRANTTVRTISYGSQYRAMGTALPTATVPDKVLYMQFMWCNEGFYDLINMRQEA